MGNYIIYLILMLLIVWMIRLTYQSKKNNQKLEMEVNILRRLLGLFSPGDQEVRRAKAEELKETRKEKKR